MNEQTLTQPSDSDLHAYVDGELDQASVLDIELWLATHPDDAAKVHTYQLQKIQLHQLYDHELHAPLPDGIEDMILNEPSEPWLTGWRQMAAGVVLLVMGGLGGWGFTQAGGDTSTSAPAVQAASASTTFVQRALNAHVVFAHDSDRPVEVAASDQTRLISWLSSRIGHKLMTPDLEGKGFSLIGGRLVADKGDPAALFMYEDKNSQRVSLYVRPGMENSNTKFRFIAESGMVAFYWTNGPLTYALSGEMHRDDLLMLATMVHDDIAKATGL